MQIRTAKQAYLALADLKKITGWSLRKLAKECRMSHTNARLLLEGRGKVRPRDKTLLAIQLVYADRDKLK